MERDSVIKNMEVKKCEVYFRGNNLEYFGWKMGKK